MDRPDAAVLFSEFVSGLQYDDLGPEVISVLKRQVLDTLGTMLAASGIGEGGREIVELVCAQGGRAESTVLSGGTRVPAVAAAFANGALAHALDFDDIFEAGASHVAISTVPAALAVAESLETPVSGAELLTALAAGAEVICRLSRAAMAADGAVPTLLASQVFGYFGAAATAARLLRLTPARTESAFGLALMQAAGTMEIVHSTSGVGKCIYAAFSNQGGVQSALLAAHGVEGPSASLEGAAGLFNAHFGGRYSRAALVDGLGRAFVIPEISFKAWPASKVTHPFVEAALQIASAHRFEAEEVEAVTLRVGPWGRAFCEPAAERARPRTSAAAKNSLPFTVAKALAHRALTLADFTAEGLADERALGVAARVGYRFEPGLGSAAGAEPGAVEVRLRSGASPAATVEVALGHPAKPLGFDAIARKFRDGARHARVVPGEPALERSVATTARLESVADVRAVIPDLLGGVGLTSPTSPSDRDSPASPGTARASTSRTG